MRMPPPNAMFLNKALLRVYYLTTMISKYSLKKALFPGIGGVPLDSHDTVDS